MNGNEQIKNDESHLLLFMWVFKTTMTFGHAKECIFTQTQGQLATLFVC